MELVTIVLLAAVLVVLLLTRRSGVSDQALQLMQGQLEALKNQSASQMVQMQKAIDDRVIEVQQKVGEGLEKTSSALSTVLERAQQIQELGKEIAGLQEILKPPALRGALGELLLEQLLNQILPSGSYDLKHTFKDGTQVDAAIRLEAGIVPVDSKFPLGGLQQFLRSQDDGERRDLRRQFIRDVKGHVDSIARKYIKPDEDTFDFALMYIPAENVYYEIVAKHEFLEGDDLYEYCLDKKVIPVSPHSFYAYLQAIALGLQGLRIEKSARDILSYVQRMQGELGQLQGDFDILGTHIKNAGQKYEQVYRGLQRFDERIRNISILSGAELEGAESKGLPSPPDRS